MKKLLYPACFYPCEDKPGAYTVTVPDLPGCISEGDSLEEALAMATDAASGWVLGEMEEGHPLPKASDVKAIHPDSPNGFVNLLVLDAEKTISDDQSTTEAEIPNQITRDAIHEAEEEIKNPNLKTYDSFDELLKDLDD